MKRQKISMATSITTNYAGELALPYISAALLSGVTLSNRSIRIMENVKKSANIPIVATSGLLAAGSCDFTDNSTVTLTERILTPIELQVNVALCKKDWIQHWEAVNMGAGRLGQNIPPNFQAYLLEHVAGKVAESIEHHIWNGEVGGSTGYDLLDGINHLLDNASVEANLFEGGANGATDANGTLIAALSSVGDPTNASHIIGIMEEVLGRVSTPVLQSSGFTIYMNNKVLYTLRRAQAALGFKDEYYERQGQVTSFLGYKVAPAYGLADTKIIFADQENLVFGTDLLSDHNEANIIDMALTDGSQNVRIVMRFTAGTQIGIVGDAYRYQYVA